MLRARLGFLVGILVVLIGLAACPEKKDDKPALPTTAKEYLHDPKMVELKEDVFPGMDGPNLGLTEDDIRGRVVWNVWCGDSGGFWNFLSQNGFGTSDLLKTIDSRGRGTRFSKIGIMNQPGFQKAEKADQYGLFIDVPKPGDPDGTIDSKIDAYTYGRSSGVVGLRLFPNPDFKGAAVTDWNNHVSKSDGINHDYYENPKYYNQKTLVRPYTVGMACAFCHVGPDPIRPPDNPEEPKWENLNDYAGAQYLKVWEVFGNGMGADSFVWQLLHSNPPGTLDTSFIATDYLNNPGTMNAVFSLKQRMTRAQDEEIKGGALALRGMTNPMKVPRVLKMGDDSVGLQAALSRVYVNIGEDWQEWLKHFNPLIGAKKQTPISVDTMQRTSAHWNWTEERSPMLAGYLIKVAQPLLLKDTKQATKYLTAKPEQLEKGKLVFAEHCARCHSSKQPPEGTDPASPEGIKWFQAQVVSDPAFFTDNFLGDERRYPVDVIGTNATRSAGTNAIRGHIWDNFSSETYKNLPAPGPLTLANPFDPAKPIQFQIPAGGTGWYRPPSLISVWATAPYLHNNMMGIHNGDPSVDGRMKAFDDGIRKLLWPSKRLGEKSIWRTTEKSYIMVPASYIPSELRDPALIDANGNLKLGPIPKGTPINLLTNINIEGNLLDLAKVFVRTGKALIRIDIEHMNDKQSTALLTTLVPDLLKVSKCPDFIEDKGHLFGTSLLDADKEALIQLLKTF
jgi:hypothetical protein